MGVIVDFWNKNAEELRNKKLFLFDMDGTIYEEDKVFGGTMQLLAYIKEIGGRFVFITNNSSKSVKDYIDKMKRLKIDCDIDNFFTSAQATMLFLKNKYPNEKVYCQGTKSLIDELIGAGIDVTCSYDDEASIVLVGFDTELTSEKVMNTCKMLQKDRVYIATNPDLRCPVGFGFIPDCGAICRMIEDATDKKPLYIGKPEPTMVEIVRQKWGYEKEETVVIGDRLYTDIATGLNANVSAVCVLTGEAMAEDIKSGNIKPTYTFLSVREMYDALKMLKEKSK